MLKETLKKIFRRDLEKLKTEIAAYRNENNLWAVEKDISNSAGNLCLHLIGNLNAFIGAELGKTDYIRNRELEFSLKNAGKTELMRKVDETINAVENTLNGFDEKNFDEQYPVIVFDEPMTNEFFLVHLAAHLSYHLGQINYHRRLLDSEL